MRDGHKVRFDCILVVVMQRGLLYFERPFRSLKTPQKQLWTDIANPKWKFLKNMVFGQLMK